MTPDAAAPRRARPALQPAGRTEAQFYSSIVKQLRQRRIESGLTQVDVAHRIGVSEYLVAKWEVLMRAPTAYNLMCWCQSLGVNLRVAEATP